MHLLVQQDSCHVQLVVFGFVGFGHTLGQRRDELGFALQRSVLLLSFMQLV
jgi:hypothetical protein